jgi:hypothetical protein
MLLHETVLESLLNEELKFNLTVNGNLAKLFEFMNQIQDWEASNVRIMCQTEQRRACGVAICVLFSGPMHRG